MAYQPPNSNTLDKIKFTQIRLGLQGYPGTGKTWSALTFPNPVVLNFDRGLGAHTGRADVTELPFWDKEFIKLYCPNQPDNARDALLKWLRAEGLKLEPDQTLVLDGSTGIEAAFHRQQDKEPVYTAQGKLNDFAPWNIKINYFAELCDLLTALKCHVVYISHEADKKDKDGGYSGKLRPLLRGQFGDQLAGKFTDWVRQMASDKPTKDLTPEKLANWSMDKVSDMKELCDSFPRNTIYYWQTESDDIFDGKVSSLINFPRYMKADYTTFRRYMKHNLTINS